MSGGLSGVAGRFSVRDLLESIVQPSKTISDQYQAVIIAMADGRTVTGRIVGLASKQGVALHELPLEAMQEVEPKITPEALKVLSVESSVKSRTSFGGTAPKNVLAQAKGWLKRLEKERKLG